MSLEVIWRRMDAEEPPGFQEETRTDSGKKRKRKNLELSGPQNRVFTLISGRAAFLGCVVVRRRRLFEAILNTPCGW